MKTQFLKVGLFTLISRVLGFVRELLFVKSLGARFISDSFLTAFRIPNTFYEIVAGGSFGPAIVPTLSSLARTHGMKAVSKFVTLLVFLVSCIMVGIIGAVYISASSVIGAIVPGFCLQQKNLSILLLRILITVILFSSVTALLAEALRIARYFAVPACGQIIVNGCFILGLLCYYVGCISLNELALFIVAGNALQCITHIVTWYYAEYRFCMPDYLAWCTTLQVIKRIIPCMLTAGIAEIALFIELQFASYLPAGSVSLLFYASSFARLPFGIFVHSLAVVLLPELARVHSYATQRLPYLLAEAYKLIIWVLLPLIIFMIWFSYDIFSILYSAHIPHDQIVMMQYLFIIKITSLLFLSYNHLILQFFYVRHETKTPTLVSLLSATLSVLCNMLLMPLLGVYGLAISSNLTALFRSLFLNFLLKKRITLRYSTKRRLMFIKGISMQLFCTVIPSLLVIEIVRFLIRLYSAHYATWLTAGYGLLVWVAPLCTLCAFGMWHTRRYYGIELRLLDRKSTYYT